MYSGYSVIIETHTEIVCPLWADVKTWSFGVAIFVLKMNT